MAYKKDLISKPYLYKILELDKYLKYDVIDYCNKKTMSLKRNFMKFSDIIKKFNKKININYYLKSVVNFYACFINYNDRYQLSTKLVLEALKKLKDNNTDKDEVNKVKVDKNKMNENKVNKNKISNIRDILAQKLAEKWIKEYIKDLYDNLKKDKTIITYL
ncbi:hypothetical protein C1645_737423 [Glomus cerebriforme]|uniref:Uncharacterized protein n=1 Tax=Glomus cerebriforme TaxID=658196 RepID=A0A397T3Z9_9GLOM|nr:hypothetical protein C1645_737423 [Glomus cerebriforme]